MTTIATLQSLLTGPVTGDQGRELIKLLIATAPNPISIEVLNNSMTHESAIVYAVGEAEGLRSGDRLFWIKSGFRKTASRPWLGVVAQEQYGVPPRDEDFATTNLIISNSSGALYGPFPPKALRAVNSTTKAVYENAEEVTIPIGPSAIITVGAVAIEAGSASDALVGEIDRLETPLEGVTVTNPQPAIGRDEESADSLNGRIDARIGVFGVPGSTGFTTGGAPSSFESIARNGVDNGGGVPRADGSRITVTRARLVRDDATGTNTLYVADDDGPIAIGDLALVAAAVQAYAEWIGSEVIVLNASAVPIVVDGTLTIANSGATDDAIFEQIDAELVSASRIAPIGGFSLAVSLRYVENAVEAAGDEGKTTAFTMVDIVLTAPTGNTALTASQVPVISRGTIAIVRAT